MIDEQEFLQLKEKVEKLAFQLKGLIATPNVCDPVAHMVIANNWGESEMLLVKDHLDEIHERLQEGDRIDWGEFILWFKTNLDVDRAQLKGIGTAFYSLGSWKRLWCTFAKEYPLSGLDDLLDCEP
ncbi:MAG: hypothetical protein JXR76_18955 [Deltaproteobacteria bacterium]|nr:hypothetical protein [Deltaproteobacteria bacterium]